ncbi:MAG: hypothetical protein ABIK43_01255 [candidate division WOR-3 bacterium]
MPENEPTDKQQSPPAEPEPAGIRFIPDERRLASIARLRKWALLLTLVVLAYGFLLLFRAGSGSAVRRAPIPVPSVSQEGASPDSALFEQPQAESAESLSAPESYPALRLAPPDLLPRVKAVVAGIDSALQVALGQWRQAEDVWLLANSPQVTANEGLIWHRHRQRAQVPQYGEHGIMPGSWSCCSRRQGQ